MRGNPSRAMDLLPPRDKDRASSRVSRVDEEEGRIRGVDPVPELAVGVDEEGDEVVHRVVKARDKDRLKRLNRKEEDCVVRLA
jgi:hypothetical protein